MGIIPGVNSQKKINFCIPSYKSAINVFVLTFILTAFTSAKAQLPTSFQKVEIASGLSNTTTFKFAPDGRIFILDRYGELLVYKSSVGVPISAGTLPVFHELEDGLLGIAFDPNFTTNNFIYLYYSPAGNSFEGNRVSRFTMNGDNLDLGSEITLLQWPTNRIAKYHSGGDMDFDSQGNLYIATGDNTTYPNTSTAIALVNTDTPAHEIDTAEKSSSNTNDLRGKILRITPQANGSYTIPLGNLFPGGTGGLPEIYVMGARNPYKIFVDDEANDWLYWGDVGPDAANASTLGPSGRDELNLTKSAENAGWPYFLGKNNDPYQIVYNGSPPFYNDPLAPLNTSVFNTGVTNLPEAQPAWVDFDNKSYLVGFRYYHDNNLQDVQRLPIEFDGKFFFYDFNSSRIWVVTLNPDGSIVEDTSSIGTVPQFAPSVFPVGSEGFIDMELGPDGKMYILAYGVPCCGSDSGPTGKLIRVDYTGIVTNSPPVVQLSATPTNGDLPLVVNFSSAGTTDPNNDSPLTYEWDFDSDGNVDSTDPNPTHTYSTAGTFNAQLKVSDGNPTNGQSIKNVTIYAGNNLAEFSINSPANGGFFNWGDDVNINVTVQDNEDGAVDCNQVILVPGFGHLNHVHPESTLNGCPQVLRLQADANHGTDGELDIFASISMEYTDTGGLISRDLLQLHPKRKEAEFYDTQSGTTVFPNNDPLEGGQEVLRVNSEGFISFAGRNLQNMTGVKYKVAAASAGGSIELRVGSTTGPLLATTQVPATGGLANWVSVESSFTDPGGQNDLYFVFKGSGLGIFDLNYVEFLGDGISIDNTPPTVESVSVLNSTTVAVQFSEYLNAATAQTLSNYTIDNNGSISSAVLQEDDRTVFLTVSNLGSGSNYNLTVANVQNTSGLAIVSNSYPFTLIGGVRINSGGPEVSLAGDTFIADEYRSGGAVYTVNFPINNTTDDALYQTEIYGPAVGPFTYEIPVEGSDQYDIRLHFAELYFGVQSGGLGSRVFDVSIEGATVLSNFDILSEVAPATALIKEFNNIQVNDGFASIQFEGVTQRAKISGIEILDKNTFGEQTNANITINSPSQNSNVNQQFDVSFVVDNWTIAEGDTHMHYYIDDVMVGPHYSYDPISIDGLSLGTHKIKLELFNINHTGTGIFDEVTVNVTGDITCNTTPFPDQWGVKQLETTSLPTVSVYTFADFDLDGDGLKDIVTGAWWYKNPGSVQGNWVRSTIGADFDNVVWIYDFDNDGDLDLLGTTENGLDPRGYEGSDLVWAQNNGTGAFTVFTNIPSGDTTYSEPFVAGVGGGIFTVGGPYQMAINWNGAEATGSPMQLLTPSANPTTGTWTLETLTMDSTGEDIQVGDIDQDNDLDLFQGSNWIRNDLSTGGGWTTFNTGITYATTPDRVQIADFDRDGDLDAVVGQLSAFSTDPDRKEFSWFAAPADPTQPWVRNVLDTDVSGSLSVFATDIDFDGDKDIVVGEWRDQYRLIAFENDLCDSGTFVKQIINAGIPGQEHHDGARVTDIDNDGDLDIISNGWFVGANPHNFPRIYENQSVPTGTQSPTASVGSDQSITLPTNSITLNGSGTDPDGGSITAYQWTQQSGPSTASLSGATTASFTANNLAEGTYVFRLTVTDDEDETGFDEVSVTVNPEVIVGGFALRINTGGTAANYSGEDFIADQYFDIGNTLDRPQTGLPEPYQTFRFSRSQVMGYDIPVADGEYTVRLHFAELWFGATGGGSGGVGSRVFDVSMEGQLVEDNLDVFDEVGADAMLVRTHTVNVSGGVLNIDFNSTDAAGGNRHPIINAIEIIGSGSTTSPPTADAGSNQSITLPTNSIILNGSGTDPDGGSITAYQWTQQSGPSTASLSGANTSNLTANNLLEGTYVFRLTVTDDENETGFDEVSVIVSPEVGTQSPTASVGSDQSITLPMNSVTLTGSGNDPDGGSITAYQWTQQSGPSTASLSGATTASLTANNLAEGTYVFRLTVTDDEDETGFDEVSVTVNPEVIVGGFALRINTGGTATNYSGEDFIGDQYFDTGNTLDRPQTGLPEPYQTFRFSRSQVMGYDIPVADGEYTVRLHFAELWFGATGGGSGGVGSRVFDVSIEGQLVEDNLDVFDEVGADAMLVRTHTVNVSGGVLNIDFNSTDAAGGNRHPIINAIEILGSGSTTSPPTANAGSNQSITLPTNNITLNGSGNDPDGGSIANYQWTQQNGPSTASLSGANTSNLIADNLLEGTYVFRLTVTDDENETGFDEVSVAVNPESITNPSEIWLEAECAVVGSGWSLINDVTASGGEYLLPPFGANYSSAPTASSSRITFNFNAAAGTYKIYANVKVPSVEDDSFWVRVNGGNWLRWNLIPGGSAFSWHQVHDRELNTVFLSFNLPEGSNTIDIAHREDGAGLDKLYVTKTTKLPSGFGDTATNCSSGASSKSSSSESENEITNIVSTDSSRILIPVLYPNPAKAYTTLRVPSGGINIKNISLFELTGKMVRVYDESRFIVAQSGIELDLIGIENGIYMVLVSINSGENYRLKLIIKN
ncbi:PKD domain-containing protein [Maribacter sp. 2308TA10-17]|uniref:PKD domain-containing protein n=1 Tax=Maribacter sp. 2308TA10-17 TaxID=3386276 RepID=UPI0039BD0CEF